jgi:hypothetical protein
MGLPFFAWLVLVVLSVGGPHTILQEFEGYKKYLEEEHSFLLLIIH